MPHHSLATPPSPSYHTPLASSYHTPLATSSSEDNGSKPPSDSLSASIRAGTFDAGANLLRTCSLPDLTSMISDPSQEGEGPGGVASEEWNVGGSPSNEDDVTKASGDESSDGEDVFYNGKETPASGEGAESDCEEEDEEDEEEWSTSEDEDLQQLVQTLQSFVEEASKFASLKGSPFTWKFEVKIRNINSEALYKCLLSTLRHCQMFCCQLWDSVDCHCLSLNVHFFIFLRVSYTHCVLPYPTNIEFSITSSPAG